MSRGASAVVLAALLALAACGEPSSPPARAPQSPPADPQAARPRRGGFEERAEAAGIAFRMAFLPGEQGERFKINFYDHGAGLAVADVDGDGHDDVYFCNQLGPNALYRNRGDGSFEDVTARAPAVALADRVSVSAAFADVDDDGDQDLYVTTTMGGNALLRNDGGLRFSDVTAEAGLALVAHSQHATFFDADLDGHVDLFVANTARWTYDEVDPAGRYRVGVGTLLDMVRAPNEPNRFYRNRGDGTFADVTDAAGLTGVGWAGDTAVLDLDHDGDLDLVVVNMFGASRVFRNDRQFGFTDVTATLLGRPSWGAVAVRAMDADADGELDLAFVDMHSDMWMDWRKFRPSLEEERRKYPDPSGPDPVEAMSTETREMLEIVKLDRSRVVFGNTLFLRRGPGRFEEVSDRAGFETLWPWGIADADYDQDGDVDVYVPSGMGYPYAYQRSVLLRNRGDGTFEDGTDEAGVEPRPTGPYGDAIGGKPAARSSRAAATLDADGDGRVDLLVQNFNDRPYLFANRWPAAPWVGFRLVGTKGHRDAVGAVVRLRTGGRTLARAVPCAGGYLQQSSRVLHFAVPSGTVEDVEVEWPGGRRQKVAAPALGRVHVVEEAP